jgi:pimeloyl-ACP methyl ester carboxylesterase
VLQRFREARPHATATTFEDAGHWPHEEEPARCVEEIARLLALPRS